MDKGKNPYSFSFFWYKVNYDKNYKIETKLKSSAITNAYLRFVRLIETLEGASELFQIDAVEKSLLEMIAIHYLEGKPLLVSEAIYLNKLGSPATLHRRLSNLQKYGLIRYGDDPDGRKKYLELTPKSRDYFSTLSKCIIKAGKPI